LWTWRYVEVLLILNFLLFFKNCLISRLLVTVISIFVYVPMKRTWLCIAPFMLEIFSLHKQSNFSIFNWCLISFSKQTTAQNANCHLSLKTIQNTIFNYPIRVWKNIIRITN
jgi:hypothetical protein